MKHTVKKYIDFKIKKRPSKYYPDKVEDVLKFIENNDIIRASVWLYGKGIKPNKMSGKLEDKENIINKIKTYHKKYKASKDYDYMAVSIDYKKQVILKKSPVVYPYKEVFESDCKSSDCIREYGDSGCGYNRKASFKMALDPEQDFYWFHNKKIFKKLDGDEIKLENDKIYILTDGKFSYYLDEVIKNILEIERPKFIESLNIYLVVDGGKDKYKEILDKLEKCGWDISNYQNKEEKIKILKSIGLS